jgi:2-polyprenyl-6-methoxyphenol hydroxylase-like FAD-dependent oxidoreductase
MNTSGTKVLIAGAGPTGLMMACQLARFGIDFIIIDKNPGPSEKSKALAVQARSLEIYEQMGIAGKAIEQGHKSKGANLVVKGKKIQRIPFGDIGKQFSAYPFLHILEQNKNESLLIEYLGQKNISVKWNTELVNFSQSEKEVKVMVKIKNEQQEIIADWLIGADGGKSPVRHLLNLKFEGDTYENIFYVADTRVEWDLGYNELLGYLSQKTLTAFFPMKGEKRFRLVGILPEQFQDEENVTFSDIESVIKNSIETKIDFSDTKWFSVYRLHHRCVSHFRGGRCFLAGDAAHIHSPAGGQGMNTGLQDTYNLAWKLALVIKKIAGENLLDSYNEERLPLAKRLVKTTDRVFAFGVSRNAFTRFVRLNIFPVFIRWLMSKKFFQRISFKNVSQIAIHYRKSFLSKSQLQNPSSEFKAGDRVPYCFIFSEELKKTVSLHELLKEPAFHILIFSKNNSEKENITPLEAFFNKNFQGLFKIVFISYHEKNKDAFEKTGVKKNTLLCIVRPDNYAGYLSDKINTDEIKLYLKEKMRFNFLS